MRDFLLTKLPDYMVPPAFVQLDALPLTPNGKVNRSALPEPEFAAAPGGAGWRRARPWRKKLAEMWKGVLGLKPVVAIHDDFIMLRGDPLRGLRVVNQLRELLGENVSPVIIFEASTIATLAERLEKNYPNKTMLCCAVAAHERGAREKMMSLTPTQDSLQSRWPPGKCALVKRSVLMTG